MMWRKGPGKKPWGLMETEWLGTADEPVMHAEYLLFISFSVAPFISDFRLFALPLFHSSATLSVYSSFLSCAQRRRRLFLAGCLWKCAVINMLPWLLILSNGGVRLGCLDKYQRRRNVCGTAQTHNEGKQLELIDCCHYVQAQIWSEVALLCLHSLK